MLPMVPVLDACSHSSSQAMYDSAMSQVYALSTLTTSADIGCGEYVDALVRARVFWYAFVVDGITSGLGGGRISL